MWAEISASVYIYIYIYIYICAQLPSRLGMQLNLRLRSLCVLLLCLCVPYACCYYSCNETLPAPGAPWGASACYPDELHGCTFRIRVVTTAVMKRFRPRGDPGGQARVQDGFLTSYMDAAVVLLTPEGSEIWTNRSLLFIQVGLLQLQRD